jgi:hypothetical protein
MGNEVLADPQDQKRLPVAGVHLNEAFNKVLDETFASGVARRPVEFPRKSHVPSMSLDDGLQLIDAWRAGQQVQASMWCWPTRRARHNYRLPTSSLIRHLIMPLTRRQPHYVQNLERVREWRVPLHSTQD